MCDFLDCLVFMDIWYVLSIECFPLAYILYKIGFPSNPLQCSCLENPRDGRACWAAIYGVAQSRTRLKRLSSSSSSSGSDGKESACNVGDLSLIPGSGRSIGGGNGNPLQYSCLENSMDRGACGATVHGATKSQTRLSNYHTQNLVP